MNILFASYQNIGPFVSNTITINFHEGKVLITAPIGTGKSFLFFDGPVFGLYKWSQRPILNKNSEKGFVKILFEESGNYYLLQRDVKKTKSGGESVSSKLFTIDNSTNVLDNLQEKLGSVVVYDQDFSYFLGEDVCEKVAFKSEQELQKTIMDVIPERNVFLNKNIYLQDGMSIFHLTPSERIDVLKEVFNLVGIDYRKDIIHQDKKDVQSKLKAYQDSSYYDQKLKKNLLEITNNSEFSFFQNKIDILEDLKFFVGENIENITFSKFDFQLNKKEFLDIKYKLEQKKNSYQELLSQETYIKQDISDNSKQIDQIHENIESINNEISQKQKKLDELKNFDVKTLKQKKSQIQENQENIIKDLNFDVFKKYGYDVNDIYEANSIVDNIISDGKNLREQKNYYLSQIELINSQKANIQEKIDNLSFQEGTTTHKNLQEKIENYKAKTDIQISKLENQKQDYKKQHKDILDQIDQYEKKIKKIGEDISFQSKFYCEKIKDDCPYMDEIKSDVISQFKTQKHEYEEELTKLKKLLDEQQYDKKIEEIDTQISDLKKQKTAVDKNPKNYFSDFFLQVDKEIKELENQMKELDFERKNNEYGKNIENIDKKISDNLEFMEKINRKKIKENIEEYRKLDNSKNDLDKKIQEYEQRVEDIQKLEEEIVGFKSKIDSYTTQKKQLQTKKKSLEDKLAKLRKQIDEFEFDKLQEDEKKLDKVLEAIGNINSLKEDFSELKLKIEKLKDEEKVLSDLYNIFSKELMLVILQNFLPQISSVLNNYLGQVVDFEVDFDLEKKPSEKLELEINIVDKYGKRPVKSLSGGQTAVLRICWILTVCSFLRTKFLFLDETINNLDNESIGKISDLLENFVKFNNVKFYVVTHSGQIQQMDIWTQKVEL
ncbi:AAA family ATPase [Candidatus Absconditicoccus praedator]|uniref:AAA family ATPase n=1 Tax=Candidatus Absconditicoccus praedator TaxID=2735562 RepID=UPI001E2C5715|nr:SMC family ATPase [Candidatus Absconditicoccus praedator]UFX83191.1 SMC family ATPase [Candidatus Absconditicoccus praedator]